jgi:cysteine desulfuration protein SufE
LIQNSEFRIQEPSCQLTCCFEDWANIPPEVSLTTDNCFYRLRVSAFGVWWLAYAEQAGPAGADRSAIETPSDMENGTWNPEGEAEPIYPKGLQKIVSLFESLPEQEKRDALISYADQARKWEPKEGETFNLEDIRKDEECTDTVGVFLKVENEERATFRVTLGPQVQTLTRAMTSILCRGLEHSTVSEILEVPSDFVPKIVGGELIRARSQTVYYVLTRMKGICKVYFDRRRAAMSR